MKKREKLKGRMASYFQLPIRLGFVLILVNILIYFLNWPSGLILSAFLVIYFAFAIAAYRSSRKAVLHEMVSFATEYGQVQKKLLRELEIPYAVLDDNGRILWMNEEFERVAHRDRGYRKSITSVFPSLTKDTLPEGEDLVRIQIDYESSNYEVQMRRIPMDGVTGESEILGGEEASDSLISIYLFDETAVQLAIQEVDDQSLVVGFIYIDNYEEALESVEDVRRSLLIALIDRRVNVYIASYDGICTKIEKDKYLIILRKKSLRQLQEAHFDLLSDVKTVNIGNEMAMTLSIGIGMEGLSYAQNYEFARNAIDLALGRGGDQAVVKSADNIIYYGGKSQQIEKSTRVKARVKAQALKEIIGSRETVFIMGHKSGDIDCLGSAIGIYRICKVMNRRAYIVMNEITTSLQPVITLFRDNEEYEKDLFLTSTQALERVTDNSALVVVDVNKPSRTECPELLRRCKSIVVLDHHRQGTERIENATLSYVEAYASSACEMVTEILQYIEGVKIRTDEADALYAGIVVDTNNFMSKAGVRTFEAAAFLRRCGADVTRVRKLFREDADEYKAKADAVSQAEIYRGLYAISICQGHDLQSPTIIGAQAANELLNIKGVKASFVLTEYQNQIHISARSIDEVNVQLIMEQMGGGGHMNIAACQVDDATLTEALGMLKRTIDEMTEEGEI
ncbi:MAG: DHH family phosphoesterase [Lachnospiraceae bacterium]|nr:DHH family phosphoesterase [Lachnospiraceae bacterium]